MPLTAKGMQPETNYEWSGKLCSCYTQSDQITVYIQREMAECVGVASAELGCAVMSDGAFLGRPLCTLVIPNTLLLRLYEEKRGLLEGVNSSITGGVLSLDPTCSRIQNALRKAANRLYSRKKSCKGSLFNSLEGLMQCRTASGRDVFGGCGSCQPRTSELGPGEK